jgi:hypothetical protein
VIPADLASRLRILIDSEVKALIPIEEVPSDLPELQPGQHFSATVQSTLSDGSFRALVAGRTVTLAMPNGAKSGDVLELVVTSNNDKVITAKLADTLDSNATTLQPKLSPAGQLISQLLTGRQGETPAVTLNRNEPLLPGPPAKAATLTPLLRQAVSESGLFYEAHQAQWVAGETTLESLLREPQGRTGLVPQGSAQSATQAGSTPLLETPANETVQSTSQPPQPQTTQPTASDANASARSATQLATSAPDAEHAVQTDNTQASHSSALKIAEQLMPLVHQQLETLATHQALWQGQVWPGQTMQWEIFDPEGQPQSSSEQADGNEPPPWQSTLRLKMPRLGGIEAQLIVTGAGVAIRVSADSKEVATQLQDGGAALGDALEAAGVPMTGFAVQLGEAREAST